MADTSAGGWVRKAARLSASTRPWACPSGTLSALRGAASRSTSARASATGNNATLDLPQARARLAGFPSSPPRRPIMSRLPAALLDQPNALDAHAALHRLHHV